MYSGYKTINYTEQQPLKQTCEKVLGWFNIEMSVLVSGSTSTAYSSNGAHTAYKRCIQTTSVPHHIILTHAKLGVFP